MPLSAAKLLDLLASGEGSRSFQALGAGGRLKPGTQLPEPQGVFPRYVDPAAEAQKKTGGQSAEEQAAAKAAKQAKKQAAREKPKDKDAS